MALSPALHSKIPIYPSLYMRIHCTSVFRLAAASKLRWSERSSAIFDFWTVSRRPTLRSLSSQKYESARMNQFIGSCYRRGGPLTAVRRAILTNPEALTMQSLWLPLYLVTLLLLAWDVRGHIVKAYPGLHHFQNLAATRDRHRFQTSGQYPPDQHTDHCQGRIIRSRWLYNSRAMSDMS